MLRFLKRWRREWEDRLRYGRLSRSLLRRWIAWRASGMPASTNEERARVIARLCTAARLANTDPAVAPLQAAIREQVEKLDERKLDWPALMRDIDKNWMVKAVILKPHVGPGEKGVIFASFEGMWVKLLTHGDVGDFAARYTLVTSPSASPHHFINYAFARFYPDDFFSLLSNPEDMVELPRISPKHIIVPMFASNWVNPDLYQAPPHRERPFDLLMVASFGKVKRHHVLFKAMRKMPRDIRVLLIGQDQEGRTANTIHEEARWYGVQDRYEIRSNQPYLKTVEAFSQARASVVLSRREGSCVVVTESMFADAPVGILHGARLGSRVYINDKTGCFLNERFLAWELTRLVRESEQYQPRQWAVENISCHESTRRLNEILREHALRNGQQWTQDIAPLQWCPDPQHLRQEDRVRLDAEREAILKRYGLLIGYSSDWKMT